MMQKRHVKEFNGVEMVYTGNGSMTPYSAVVLASRKHGISVKFYPKDAEEKESLIQEYVRFLDWSYDKAKAHIEDPTYCFISLRPSTAVADIRRMIKEGNINFMEHGNNPICPFA